MIISKTPLRISFAGGGTDLPSFYENNDYGAVLSTSIDSYIYVTVKKHTTLFKEKIRLNYSEAELINDINEIKNPIIRECIKFLEIDDRLYINTIADAPGSSGLGSSSTFCVGLLNALYNYQGVKVSRARLAEESYYIEKVLLKRPVGKQDHYAGAFGGMNFFRFKHDNSVTIIPIQTSLNIISIIFNSMLSFWTGISRPSETVLKEQDENNSINSEVLLKIRDQSEELLGLLIENNFTIEKLGKLVHLGWQLKKQLASKVSNNKIDEYYEIAMKTGCYGGKISGAGGGGFLNVFADEKNHSKITIALKKYGLIPFKFNLDTTGTTVTKLF